MKNEIGDMNRLAHGDIAKFTKPGNGYPHDQKVAAKHLTEGESYTVDKVEVHSWHTKIWLKEVPDVSFNSVLFNFWMKEDDDG